MATEDMSTEELTRRLTEAAGRPMTRAQKRSQRISFVMGMCGDDNTMTREDVARILDEMEGVDE